MQRNPAATDPEILEALYWREGLSMARIANRLDVSEKKIYDEMVKHGIDRRGVGYNSTEGQRYKKSLPYRTGENGYPRWHGSKESDGGSGVYVHQLLLISEGADPGDVFDDEWHCHHKNGIPWDNRPENLQLMLRENHGRHHAIENGLGGKGKQEAEKEDLLGWICAFASEFGVVPSQSDMRNWPGPSPPTYRKHFGSIPSAVEAAGYEPRGESR